MMIQALAERIVRYIGSRCPLCAEEREKCKYSLRILLYTVFSTAGLLMIGMISGSVWQTVLVIAVLYANQTVGGGYHADTEAGCFTAMAAGLTGILILIRCRIPLYILVIILVLSYTVLLLIPVTFHRNKKYLQKTASDHKRRSEAVSTLCFAACSVLCIIQAEAYYPAMILSCAWAALSRVIGLIRNT